jgi:hypothetical protein
VTSTTAGFTGPVRRGWPPVTARWAPGVGARGAACDGRTAAGAGGAVPRPPDPRRGGGSRGVFRPEPSCPRPTASGAFRSTPHPHSSPDQPSPTAPVGLPTGAPVRPARQGSHPAVAGRLLPPVPPHKQHEGNPPVAPSPRSARTVAHASGNRMLIAQGCRTGDGVLNSVGRYGRSAVMRCRPPTRPAPSGAQGSYGHRSRRTRRHAGRRPTRRRGRGRSPRRPQGRDVRAAVTPAAPGGLTPAGSPSRWDQPLLPRSVSGLPVRRRMMRSWPRTDGRSAPRES